jgi:hypothetical protein
MSASQTEALPAAQKGPGKAAKTFSIRLTDDEKLLLRERAGRLSLGTYIRDVVLAQGGQAPRRRCANPVKDHEALARVLAALGQSRLSSNLNQLAKAVNIGALPVTPETEQEISDACVAVGAVRRELMRALGSEAGDFS